MYSLPLLPTSICHKEIICLEIIKCIKQQHNVMNHIAIIRPSKFNSTAAGHIYITAQNTITKDLGHAYSLHLLPALTACIRLLEKVGKNAREIQ